jgi:hypothetical protein
MTTIAEGLRVFLLADATVAGLVGTRVFPVILPQAAVLQQGPAITYQYVGGASDISTDGATGLTNPTFQIDCWAMTYSAMDGLFEAVRKRLNGHRGTMGTVAVYGVFLVRKRDLYDNEAKIHRRTADWSIWNKEALT